MGKWFYDYILGGYVHFGYFYKIGQAFICVLSTVLMKLQIGYYVMWKLCSAFAYYVGLTSGKNHEGGGPDTLESTVTSFARRSWGKSHNKLEELVLCTSRVKIGCWFTKNSIWLLEDIVHNTRKTFSRISLNSIFIFGGRILLWGGGGGKTEIGSGPSRLRTQIGTEHPFTGSTATGGTPST
jgi:hypothetical protein